MDDHISDLARDVDEISENAQMSTKSSPPNITFCGQKMNAEIFLAKVRYMLVCNLTW